MSEQERERRRRAEREGGRKTRENVVGKERE